jgi:hypothetical protein
MRTLSVFVLSVFGASAPIGALDAQINQPLVAPGKCTFVGDFGVTALSRTAITLADFPDVVLSEPGVLPDGCATFSNVDSCVLRA